MFHPPNSTSQMCLVWVSLPLSAWNFRQLANSSSFLNCSFLARTLLVCCLEAVNTIFLECASIRVISLTNAAHGLPMAFRMKLKLSGLASLTFSGLASVYLTSTPAHLHRGFLLTLHLTRSPSAFRSQDLCYVLWEDPSGPQVWVGGPQIWVGGPLSVQHNHGLGGPILTGQPGS